jgi:hypothetical protein
LLLHEKNLSQKSKNFEAEADEFMTVPTSLNNQDDSQNKCLSPDTVIGQRFTHWYNHGWRHILALTPEEGDRPSWHTETRYPLEPRDLWDLYQDPEVLLGLCFGKYSRYLMSDIDPKSKNHPLNSPERYEGILKAMEGIGLCRPIVVRSSDSGGLHVYWYLPYAVHSFSLALAAKRALNKAEQHYKLIDGQLELFPNPKDYDSGRITNFKPHRLPLQAGSFLLDWELQPISKSVGTLMDWADWSAEGQDMELLEEAMAKAQVWLKEQEYFYKKRVSVEQFALDLEKQIATGWTSYGQTNFLLWKFAMNGIIFERLQNEELVQYMLETAVNAPGYERFCRHRREIEKRVRDWAKCAQKYYYPFSGNPPRDKTLKEVLASNSNIDEKEAPFAKSRERREQNIKELIWIVAILKGERNYPKGVDKRLKTIIGKSKKMYSEGFSQQTLYRKEYKYLWHPDYESVKEWGVNPDSSVSKYPAFPDPWNEREEKAKAREEEGLESLQVETTTEGVLFLAEAKENRETERSEGRIVGEEVNSENPSLDRVSLILVYLVIDSNLLAYLISETDCNSCIQELKNGLEQVIDKGFLYHISTRASAKKSSLGNQENLLLLRIILASILEPKQPSPDHQKAPERPEKPCNSDVSVNGNGFSHNGFKAAPSTPNSPPIPAPDASGTVQSEASNQVPVTSPSLSFLATPTSEDEPVDTPCSSNGFTPLQYREAIRFKLQALPQAKHLVKVFCNSENVRLMPKERENLEQLVKHYLMERSPSPILHEEAEAWFVTHEELIAQIKSCLGTFWEYFENLRI